MKIADWEMTGDDEARGRAGASGGSRPILTRMGACARGKPLHGEPGWSAIYGKMRLRVRAKGMVSRTWSRPAGRGALFFGPLRDAVDRNFVVVGKHRRRNLWASRPVAASRSGVGPITIKLLRIRLNTASPFKKQQPRLFRRHSRNESLRFIQNRAKLG